jgi:hypothetical protein
MGGGATAHLFSPVRTSSVSLIFASCIADFPIEWNIIGAPLAVSLRILSTMCRD